MRRISKEVEQLERQRQERHNELSDVRSMVVFILQAVTFWKEVAELARGAGGKTENIQKIVERAQKKDSVRILTSKGTRIKMKSFKECWMELVQTINSDENNVIFQRQVPKYALCVQTELVFVSFQSKLPEGFELIHKLVAYVFHVSTMFCRFLRLYCPTAGKMDPSCPFG